MIKSLYLLIWKNQLQGTKYAIEECIAIVNNVYSYRTSPSVRLQGVVETPFSVR